MHVIKDTNAVEQRRGTIYPPALAAGFDNRIKRFMTDALGLTQFGINMTTIEPGAQSSHRHWHVKEDECVYMLSGEAWLVTETGDTLLTAGMAAGFPAGEANAHHLVNRSQAPATYLEIGTRSPDETVTYADVDLKMVKSGGPYKMMHKSGEAY